MIKENQRLLNQLHVLSDGLLVFLCALLAYKVRFGLLSGSVSYTAGEYLMMAAAATGVCMLSYGLGGLYHSYRTVRFHREAGQFLLVHTMDIVLLQALLFLFRMEDMSRWTLVFFYLFSAGALLVKRGLLRSVLRYYRRMGYNLKHVLVVGDGPGARKYVTKIREDKNLGYSADGYVASRRSWKDLHYAGDYGMLEEILDRMRPDEVVVALDGVDLERMGEVISACEKTGTKVSVIPFYADYMPANPQVDDVDGLPLINLRRIPLDNMGNAAMKRTMDIVGSLLLILLTSPLMLLAAVGVKLSSPGPVIFRQERVGKGKKMFYMYKFRSMRLNDREQTGWSTNSDSRKTPFGALIRKLSIDELPQFFNVLKGDMSLVGPRPEVPHFVEQFKEEIPRYMVKHQVRPGITGWAQVNGLRGDTSIRRRVEYDLYYIENWNLIFDLRILFMTLFRLVNREQLKG